MVLLHDDDEVVEGECPGVLTNRQRGVGHGARLTKSRRRGCLGSRGQATNAHREHGPCGGGTQAEPKDRSAVVAAVIGSIHTQIVRCASTRTLRLPHMVT